MNDKDDHILVKKYLKEHSLVESNITSFNNFINHRIQEIIDELNETLPSEDIEIKLGKIVLSKNQYSNFEMDTSYLYNKDIRIPKETSKGLMWLMGILLGDGYVDLEQNKINIATHETEDYREDLIKLIKKLFFFLERVLGPLVISPHGVTEGRPPEVLPSPPPCG